MSNYNEAILKIKVALINRNNFLDLSSLNLTNLPDELGELTFLTNLDLSFNNFNRLPPIINSLFNLQRLNLSFNSFSYTNGIGFDFPNYLQIRELDLSNNLIDKIPQDLFNLEQLEDVILTNNPVLDNIPSYIIEKGIEYIDSYYEGIHFSETTDVIFEAKLIFVGQGEVGKTSLMKKLMNPEIEIIKGEENTTHGINIEKWFTRIPFSNEEIHHIIYNKFDYLEDDDEEIYLQELVESNFVYDEDEEIYYKEAKLNIWDFGGQDIYYSTHEFFLTKRSIYIFVWDARKEEELRGFEYWFNTINVLSEKSPVLIVMNKSDERSRPIDEISLKKQFQNIIGYHKVSCINGSGIFELYSSIINTFKQLPQIRDRLPKAWVIIRNKLRNLDRNYISFNEYTNICTSSNIPRSNVNILSEYLHDLGDILHFKKDPILRNMVILNPEWVTNACYNLIDNISIQDNYGRFSFNELSKFWKLNEYPRDKHYEIISLLQNFEICFNLIGTHDYIIPALLKVSSNYNSDFIIKNSKIKFEYDFKFMPEGLMARFICRNHFSIEKDYFWKYGVILKFDDSVSLIISEPISRKIKIFVTGEDCDALFGIIRKEFEIIFETLKLVRENDYNEMIPCNCDLCKNNISPYFHRFSVLKLFRQKNKLTIDCQKSAEAVEVLSLIKGYTKIRPIERTLENLLVVCAQLQNQRKLYDNKEDSRNGIIANALNNRGINAKDQTRLGSSPSKKSQGEIDIKLESSTGLPLSIFEGLNLDKLDTKKIHSHVEKMFYYDFNGLENNFLVIYCDSNKFSELWDKYKFAVVTANTKYKLEGEFHDVSDLYAYGSYIKVGKTMYKINENLNSLYHLFIDMADD
ncbi:COR domain-containing protein [Spirosoma agri]|uniref:non-specific serine/threonine protein kinase n=1 Tax=Spirosoma agri TaxID=1987381 RepID=A0A6M0IDW3_9BACT|nr:COR domain-containing protein [Spirosoma agri]NEU65945.1 hypothetical protein [Spirosoma agri]